MSFALIDAKKADVAVETACAVLNVSVSGFYAWKNRPASKRQTDDMVLLAHIRAEFATSNETYGSPRMHAELKESGLAMGVHRVARLMSENGLKARQKTRFKRTTDSDHGGLVAKNVLDQDFTADAPDQKWGVDISYVWTAEGWLYLAIVLDLYSRKIVGWSMSDRMKKGLAMEALRRAIILRQPPPGLIHHSDRGSQYCADDYRRIPEGPRLRRVDERAWKLLRQCHGRDGLQDHQIRVGLADFIRVAHRGRQRDRTIHRRLL